MKSPEDRTLRQLRLLRAHALVTTSLLLILGVAAFAAPRKTRFGEIDVERINIVEPDGKLRLVIANRPRSPGPIARGKPFGYPGGSRPGMIFFNDEESETGGFIWQGKKGADGRVQASQHLSFDQFDQDQVMFLQYIDEGGQRLVGLTVADRADIPITDVVARKEAIDRMPEGAGKTEALRKLQEPIAGAPLMARRVFVGRDRQKAATLVLSDPMGRPRLKLQVDAAGAPRLEFLDEHGKVTRAFP
jgi:hypothetical protein